MPWLQKWMVRWSIIAFVTAGVQTDSPMPTRPSSSMTLTSSVSSEPSANALPTAGTDTINASTAATGHGGRAGITAALPDMSPIGPA